ncbi:MAG: FAD-dependent oxidoreductase [Candidatus Omnitrophica bacterium]|nr:FAD-dependent oxidoreductase [Candidatus Omnitrophota bacterium]
MKTESHECCILGAGPAGFGTALELTRHGVRDIVIVDRNRVVGGLARTEIFGGSRFDVGPHRFFTKNTEINQLWHDTLGSDFRPVNRLTRIYYKGRYFLYPLKALNALSKLGPAESIQALLSFAAAQLTPQKTAVTFEDWVTQKFGRKLYETFFKTYTEKVWGIPCRQIGAEWAAQRIKDLDVIQVLKHSLFANAVTGRKIKTLVDQFDYPVRGAGQMYEAMQEKCAAAGVKFLLGCRIQSFLQEGDRIACVEVHPTEGEPIRISAKQFFNSIPITHFFKMLQPAPSEEVRKAAEALYYREHITVDLLVDGDDLFPDQWIYVHSPDVGVARLANYNNFSKAMVGRKGKSALSVEYFTFQHEDLWKMPDEELKALAVEEIHRMGLVAKERVEQAWVVRETESYPTYYLGFQEPYNRLKNALDQFSNLHPIGRGGLYKYNNQDHSTYSGILAARNYLQLPGSPYNLWNINIDAEYLEAGKREDP